MIHDLDNSNKGILIIMLNSESIGKVLKLI